MQGGPSWTAPAWIGPGVLCMVDVDISKSRVYVADDVSANRLLLDSILRRGGLTDVHLYGDGRQLLDAVADQEPDLILLDLRMPDIDGYEVLRQLEGRRAQGSFLPVVVLTAESGQESRRVALETGANDYVTKPFDAAEVMLRVRNLLHTRALHETLRSQNVDLAGQVDDAREDLSKREREWEDVARSLADLEARATSEDTAHAICNELKRISGLASVVIVALDAAGRAIPLAVDGIRDARVMVNHALPQEPVERWLKKVGRDPWIGPWEQSLGTVLQRIPRETPTAVAIVPLNSSGGMLGVLAATTGVSDGVTYLSERLSVLRSFGAIASALLAPSIQERQRRGAIRAQLEDVLVTNSFTPVVQPIIELATDRVVGVEALTRFGDGTRPDRRFADASAVGLGIELETATLAAALSATAALPSDLWLSLNVSPDFLLDATRLQTVLTRGGRRRLVLEITEHVAIEDYVRFRSSVASLGSTVGFAVDDAGAGYASFKHILELHPEFVKLDLGLVHEVDRDEIRQALIAGIVYFAERSGCALIAEGVETTGERSMLERLGVQYGQGYLLGRPGPPEAMVVSRPRRTSPAATPDPTLVRPR